MTLADLMITGSEGTFCMPCLVVVGELTMMSTTSMPTDHFAEYGVAIALIEEIVVLDVDEELAGRRIRYGGASHGQGTAHVGQTIFVFVLDRRLGFFLLHLRGEATALRHEARDHTVKNGIGVKPLLT